MADLLEARAEAVGEQLDVVALGARGLEEGPVGHQQRRREVVGERDAGERARLGVVSCSSRTRRSKSSAWVMSPTCARAGSGGCAAGAPRRREDAPLGVVAAHRLALVGDADDLHLDAVRGREVAHEPAVDVVRVELGLRATSRSAASSSSGKWFMCRWMKSLTSSDGRRLASTPASPSPWRGARRASRPTRARRRTRGRA